MLVVGGGPSGSSCAYWLAEAGWDVALVEKKEFPREKTCGDGLTPRSVRQLADMGIEGSLAGAHRYAGLRAHAFGKVLDLPWPEHPSFPSYGYVITRHDLDALVNERAAKAGATVWQGTEAIEPILDAAAPAPAGRRAALVRRRRGEGQGRRHGARGAGPVRGGGRRGQLAVRAGPRHQPGPVPADGHGPARLLHLPRPRPAVHRVPPRHPRRRRQGGPGLRLDLPAGRRPGERRRRAPLDRPAVEGGQHGHADGALRGLGPEGVGALPGHGARPAHRGQAARWVWPSAPGSAPPPWWSATPPATINPFNGEGIAYGYETGRLAAASLGEALSGDGFAALLRYEDRLEEAYGLYFRVARAFIRVIARPELMKLCVGTGMHSETLMTWILRIMSNLVRPGRDRPGRGRLPGPGPHRPAGPRGA